MPILPHSITIQRESIEMVCLLLEESCNSIRVDLLLGVDVGLFSVLTC